MDDKQTTFSPPLTYAELVETAKRNPPPQSWFEEDFSGLRGPKKTLKQVNAERKISSKELRRRVRANTKKLTGREVI